MTRRRRRFAGQGEMTGNPAEVLATLASGLASGGVRVVDLTAQLGPDTPILRLPTDLAKNTPKVAIHRISDAYRTDRPIGRSPFNLKNYLAEQAHDAVSL